MINYSLFSKCAALNYTQNNMWLLKHNSTQYVWSTSAQFQSRPDSHAYNIDLKMVYSQTKFTQKLHIWGFSFEKMHDLTQNVGQYEPELTSP